MAIKEVNGIDVDDQRVENILRWVIKQEALNVKTRERTESQMIADIQKRIEEEVNQCY